MMCHHATLFSICLLATTQIVGANGSAVHFESIASKNAFRLKPPTLKERPLVEVIERPHIAFQGLTTLLGRPQALLQIQKPKTTGLGDISCIMAEGESREGVSVLAINMETQTVRINNVELKQTLRLGP